MQQDVEDLGVRLLELVEENDGVRPAADRFFFSSRRRHTSLTCDWSQTCALPIYALGGVAGGLYRLGSGLAGKQRLGGNLAGAHRVRSAPRRTGVDQGAGRRSARSTSTSSRGAGRRSEERRVGKERMCRRPGDVCV